MSNDFSTKEVALYVVAMVLATLVVTSPVTCTVAQSMLITEAIKSGVDPEKARCSIKDPITPNCLKFKESN